VTHPALRRSVLSELGLVLGFGAIIAAVTASVMLIRGVRLGQS
jgi:hypothetical protein